MANGMLIDAPQRHVVDFYCDDGELVGRLGEHIVGGLQDGDAVVIIATPSHRNAIAELLTLRGLNIEAASRTGSLTLLDAAETLDQVVVDGHVDSARFDAVIGEFIRTAVGGGRTVRA